MDISQKQSIQIPAEIRVYLEDLLNASGVVSVDPVMREAMIQELYVRLDKFITLKLLDYLPTEKLEEFADITDQNPSPEAIQQYIQAHVPNAQEVFAMAFGEFRDLYLNGMHMQKNNAEQ